MKNKTQMQKLTDISNLSVPELRTLLQKVDTAIANRTDEEREKLTAELTALAAAAGYTVDEILEDAPKPTRRRA